MQELKIDLDRLANLAHTGVRRAAIFMGLGLNAAHREDFQDYQLQKLPVLLGQSSFPIDFLPYDLPVERVEEFKREFAVWVTGNGRELIEHYALFLDQIHTFSIAVYQVRRKLDKIGDREKRHRQFHHAGVPEKLDLLKTRFDLGIFEADSIAALYQARNCLTHDFGIVSVKRFNEPEKLTLTWRALDFVSRGEDSGTETPLIEFFNKASSEASQIFVRQPHRRKVLHSGDKLRFTQQDLWEICYFFNAYAIPNMLTSFVSFLKNHDVAVGIP